MHVRSTPAARADGARPTDLDAPLLSRIEGNDFDDRPGGDRRIAFHFKDRLQHFIQVVNRDFIGEDEAHLSSYTLIQQKHQAGYLAHKFDEDTQLDIFEINSHQVGLRCGRMHGNRPEHEEQHYQEAADP